MLSSGLLELFLLLESLRNLCLLQISVKALFGYVIFHNTHRDIHLPFPSASDSFICQNSSREACRINRAGGRARIAKGEKRKRPVYLVPSSSPSFFFRASTL